MERALQLLFGVKPLLFAFGFLTPVLAQVIKTAECPVPPGLSPVATAAIISGAWGLIAMLRGRWL